MARPVDFVAVNAAALRSLFPILQRWLPDGRLQGHEWQARNPTRADKHAGSFSVNIRTGRWSDFATGDRGGDVVSLCAFLFDCPNQAEAAVRVAAMLGVEARP